MSSIRDVDAEFLYPSDGQILDIYERDGEVWLTVAVPDADSDRTLRLEARVEEVTETDLELPLDDAEDYYD